MHAEGPSDSCIPRASGTKTISLTLHVDEAQFSGGQFHSQPVKDTTQERREASVDHHRQTRCRAQASRVDFIKMDIEGAEVKALRRRPGNYCQGSSTDGAVGLSCCRPPSGRGAEGRRRKPGRAIRWNVVLVRLQWRIRPEFCIFISLSAGPSRALRTLWMGLVLSVNPPSFTVARRSDTGATCRR